MDVRIVIRGRLSERLCARFDGVTAVPSGDVTVLSGDLADQAQLHGILDRIRDLGLELVAVEAGPSTVAPAHRGGPASVNEEGT